ncbi:MAG: radical SAM protein [bacterium]
MKLSPWCHLMRRDDVSALVHALTLEVIYFPTEDLNDLLTKLDAPNSPEERDLVELLTSKKMLVDNAAAPETQIIELREKLQAEISLELLYLLVTDGCNLRCVYCFEETPGVAGKFKSVQMDTATVKKAIDLFAVMTAKHGNPEKKKVIHLYGGEPLANRQAVYEAIEYASGLKARGVLPGNCQLAIVTNGVLVNDADAERFAKHGVTVGLSIDGPAFITDLYRVPKRPGVRVTERVTRAFKLLKRQGVSVGLSVTLTPEAVAHFEEFLDFFTTGEFSGADGLSLNLLHYSPNIVLPPDYYAAATECQIRAFQRFREIGIYEERIMRKARAFVDQAPMYADCGVVGHQLVVAPDGRVGVCQDFVKPRTYFPRSVNDASHEELLGTLFAEWRNRSPLFMPQCQACEALGICGGGCPASAELQTGNRWNLDPRACAHSKRALEWLVWDAYANQSD